MGKQLEPIDPWLKSYFKDQKFYAMRDRKTGYGIDVSYTPDGFNLSSYATLDGIHMIKYPKAEISITATPKQGSTITYTTDSQNSGYTTTTTEPITFTKADISNVDISEVSYTVKPSETTVNPNIVIERFIPRDHYYPNGKFNTYNQVGEDMLVKKAQSMCYVSGSEGTQRKLRSIRKDYE